MSAARGMSATALLLTTCFLIGCNEPTGPQGPELPAKTRVAIDLDLSLTVIGPESLFVSASVRNVGAVPVKYNCSPLVPRIRLIDAEGRDVRLRSSCIEYVPCRLPISTLGPQQTRSCQSLIAGRYSADCDMEPLPAGTYGLLAELWYWVESEPGYTGWQLAEKEVLVQWPVGR